MSNGLFEILKWPLKYFNLVSLKLLDIFGKEAPRIRDIIISILTGHRVPTKEIQHSSIFFVFFDNRVILKQNTVFDEWTIDYDPRLFV